MTSSLIVHPTARWMIIGRNAHGAGGGGGSFRTVGGTGTPGTVGRDDAVA